MNKLPLVISGLLWYALLPGYGFAAANNYEENLKQLAEGVMAEAVKAKKERLAIVDFTDSKGIVTPAGQFLAEELSTQLLVAGELKVVERRLVNSTLKKLHIKEIDSTPPKAVKGAAKAIRADAFVVGSYLESLEGVLVTTKLISPLNAQAVGAARKTIPKTGPLGELLKAANTPPVKVELPKDPPVPEGLGFHRNDLYEFVVRSLSSQDQQIRLDVTVENRSPRDLKILCLLQNTVLRDEQGTQWVQKVEDNREGLCTRGMELSPRKKDRAVFTFTAPADAPPAAHFTLAYHEKSPRWDAGFFIEGLKADAPSSPAVSVTP